MVYKGISPWSFVSTVLANITKAPLTVALALMSVEVGKAGEAC